jgi:hypothetical protein
MKFYSITIQKSVEDELMRLQAKRRKNVRREWTTRARRIYNPSTNPSEAFHIYLKQGYIEISKLNASIKNILTSSKQNDATKRVRCSSRQTIMAALIDRL